MIEESQPDKVEASYGVEVEELLEDGRCEVGTEVCGVVDRVTGDLLRENVREVDCEGVREEYEPIFFERVVSG